MTAVPTMPPELWQQLVSTGQRRYYPAGSLIFAEGDPAGPVLAVMEGLVALTAGRFDGRLAEVPPGQLLGELSAVDGLPRSAAALAVTDTEILAIDPDRFAQLLAELPPLALYVVRFLAARLRAATASAVSDQDGADLRAVAKLLLGSDGVDPAVESHTIASLARYFDVDLILISRVLDHLVDRGAVVVDRGVVDVADPILLGGVAGFGHA